MQTHDQYIVATLRSEIAAAARSLEAPDDAFDFYAITGDISTNANSGSRFAFARRLLTDSLPVRARARITPGF